MFHLHSLGQCMITLGATRIVPTAKLMFASALYVAVEGVRPIARESMASLFWPELDEEKATHSLRQALYRLRASGVPISGDSERIQVPDGVVTTDYSALLANDASVPVNEMLERIPGGFLPGYIPSISGPFAEWVEGQRERVNAVLRRQLVSGIITLRAAGDWPATQALAQRCLELDPLNEEATLALAEAMAMDGSKARAIMLIERYMNEVGPRSKELYLPATTLKKRISELYPLPPVIEREPPHTGREEQMEMLDSALKDARQGRGSAFLISGPPGMGKTRLVTEFTRAAQLQGIATARSQMGRHDDHRPLGAWSDVVPTLQRMAGALGCDPESLPFLRRLTTYDSTQTSPSPETQDAEYLFARMRMSIIDLVCAVASESCVILLIEDVHWMDEWSWDVMTALTKKLEKTGVVILMTRRDGEEPSTPVPDNAVLQEVVLAPLGDAKCRKLLGFVAPAAKASDQEFADWCVKTCSGNPYFLVELARRASGEDGRFVAPPSLTRLISQRFSDVMPLSRRVLQVTALLGNLSTVRRIEQVLDERRLPLLDSLDELAQASLITVDGECVICRHDIMGMSALGTASPASLSLLRRHAARVLESEARDESAPFLLWEALQLLLAAGDRARALTRMAECASRAIEVGTPAEAIRVLDHASRVARSEDEIERVNRQRIRALYFAREYQRMLSLVRTTRKASYDAVRALNHTNEELFELEAILQAEQPTADLVSHSMICAGDTSASAAHRVEAALIGCKAAFVLDMKECADRLLALVADVVASDPTRSSRELQLVYHGSFGSLAEAARCARALREIAASGVELALRSRTLVNCALAFYASGDLQDAIECCEESMESAERLGAAAAFRSSWVARLNIAIDLGDDATADALLTRPQQDAAGCVEERSDEVLRRQLARRALSQGDLVRARELIGPFESIWVDSPSLSAPYETEVRARYLLQASGWVPSDEEMNRLVEVQPGSNYLMGRDSYVSMLLMALMVRNDHTRARILLSDYLSRQRRELTPLFADLRRTICELDSVAAP